ncbi:MAG: hypothetical protein MJ170_03520 [Alphaproteobacteria bacterium]|nr:hypothetical protein [Alphaproteobacteria bacterium]
MINLSDVKLIIWDLDDTFWNGNLAQGTAEFIDHNNDFVRNLTGKGIMNSICSKNDYAAVKEKFNGYDDLFDLFIFKSINWEPKGPRIKNIIENAQLRPVNVLFIDDNTINLNEALFYNPGINVCTPDQINALISQLPEITKSDLNHSRLKQYKILETKVADKQKMGSNDKFLQESQICVQVHHDCIKNIDRLHELLIRSNQLNYTKNRCSIEELTVLLKNKKVYESGYITCNDKYGDYGIIGMYVLNKRTKTLEHFLFSCRTLGMGVEQYVYAKLGFPKLTTVGDVAVKVLPQKYITYITEKHGRVKKQKKTINILLKGPCDLSGIMPYLDSNIGIDTEFIHANENAPATCSQQHSRCAVDSKRLKQSEIETILNAVPMLSPEDYTTNMYNDKYDVVVFSLLIDDLLGLYRDKETGLIFPFGNYNIPITENKNKSIWTGDSIYARDHYITPKQFDTFSKKLEYLGPITNEMLIEHLMYIRQNISPKAKLVIIMGSELKPLCEPFDSKGLYLRHIDMNRAVQKWVNDQQNVSCINLTDFIKNPEDYRDMINHFQRHVYYKFARALSAQIPGGIRVHDKNYFKKIITIDKHKRKFTKNDIKYKQEQLFLHFFGLNIPLSRKHIKRV